MVFSMHEMEAGKPAYVLEVADDNASSISKVGLPLRVARPNKAKSDAQVFRQHRDLPGSGTVLSRVLTRSRTCVLQFYDRTDTRHSSNSSTLAGSRSNLGHRSTPYSAPGLSTSGIAGDLSPLHSDLARSSMSTQISIHLPMGVSLSLLNKTPQELIVFAARGMTAELTTTGITQTASLQIEHYQVRTTDFRGTIIECHRSAFLVDVLVGFAN
jgi:hypothetical protein